MTLIPDPRKQAAILMGMAQITALRFWDTLGDSGIAVSVARVPGIAGGRNWRVSAANTKTGEKIILEIPAPDGKTKPAALEAESFLDCMDILSREMMARKWLILTPTPNPGP